MKTPFTISKELASQVEMGPLLLAGLVEVTKPADDENDEPEYCLSLDGINYSWFTLKVIRDYVIEKN